MIRWIVGGALSLSVLAGVLLAAPGVVTTHQGQSYSGEITESPQSVTIDSRGVQVVLPWDRVSAVTYIEDVEQAFRERMRELAPDDAAGRLAVARWAFERRAYLLAREAAADAQRVDPNSLEARHMLDTIQGQIRLEQRAADRAADGGADGPTTRPRLPQPRPVEDPRTAGMLRPDQINTIRLTEMQPADAQMRFNFVNDVRRRYANRFDVPIQQLLAQPPFEQAQEILLNGIDDMRADVRAMSDPGVILDYRRTVQPLILANCATASCHGSASGAGDFRLYRGMAGDALTYTNFFILQTSKVPVEAEGVFGGGNMPMIDRMQPEQSMLLHLGLPPDQTRYEHPPVRNWRPLFRSREDSGYLRTLDWIASLNVRDPGNYGITPPWAKSSEQPATQPVAEEPAPAPPEAVDPASNEPAAPLEPSTTAADPRGAAQEPSGVPVDAVK